MVEPVVFMEGLSSLAAGVEAEVGTAVERRGCAGAGLSREKIVRMSKFTRGQEAGVERELWSEISQEKVIFSMSQWRDSLADMGFLRVASHSMDSTMATAAVVK